MMDNEGIAPVIAVMFILAIGVTFFSVYTTTYLPSLKQQAEIEHLENVETGIVRFSSDIDNAILAGTQSGRGGRMSEQVRLGGGAILLNSLESSGIIRIQPTDSIVVTIITNDSQVHRYDLSLANFSYRPSNNFWIDQGYTWQYGYVNVTKGIRSAPLQYDTVSEIKSRSSAFINGLVTVHDQDHGSNISLDIVSLSAGPDRVTSGNGVAKISLDSNVTNEYLPDCVNLTYEKFNSSAAFSVPFQKVVTTINYSVPVNISVRKVDIAIEVR